MKNSNRNSVSGIAVSNWLYQKAIDSSLKKKETLEKTLEAERVKRKPQITSLAQKTKPAYMNHRKTPTTLESVPEAPLRSARIMKPQSISGVSSAAKRSTPQLLKMTNEESEL